VLAAAKEDARLLQSQLGQVVAELLAGCEAALKTQAERDARQAELALQRASATTTAAAATAAGKRAMARAVARRSAPVIRRIERDISLLQRLCTQLICHRVLSLLYSSLFPLYCCVSARRNTALQMQLYRHRTLSFRQMGLAEELIFTNNNSTSGDISYQHASQAHTDTNARQWVASACAHAHNRVVFCCSLFSVDAFGSLSRLQSPIDKLQCVVSVAKAICACVDQANQQQQQQQQQRQAAEGDKASAAASPISPVVIGADDLLLLFVYLLVHSRLGVPALLAELAFLADFIPEHKRCTMEGYYLAVSTAAAELITSGEILQGAAAQAAAQRMQQAQQTAASPSQGAGNADTAVALPAAAPQQRQHSATVS